jgi:hypothetical protein
MNVALLRVGIDSNQNTGGIHGPLFEDGSFEFIPIMDEYRVDKRTYGDTNGQCNPNKHLIEYFPQQRRDKMKDIPIHFDPEFESYTYGRTSAGGTLGGLGQGDMLIFYCGLQGCDGFQSEPALYLMGYFEVEVAGRATDFKNRDLRNLFGKNFHIMHQEVYEREREKLVLVKGYPPGSNGRASRLLKRAIRISAEGNNCRGSLSIEMQNIFGNFNGKICFWRGLHWVDEDHVESAVNFVRQQK